MKQEILERLMEITPEEQAILDGNPCPNNKELLIIPSAVHTDLYDGGGKGAIPFDKLEDFFHTYLR